MPANYDEQAFSKGKEKERPANNLRNLTGKVRGRWLEISPGILENGGKGGGRVSEGLVHMILFFSGPAALLFILQR